MMQAIKQSSFQRLQKLFTHAAGSNSSAESIIIGAPNHSGTIKIIRRNVAGVIRDIGSSPYTPPSSYLEGDTLSTNVAAEDIVILKANYQQIKSIDIIFAESSGGKTGAWKIEELYLVGNIPNPNMLPISNILFLNDCLSLKKIDIRGTVEKWSYPTYPTTNQDKKIEFIGFGIEGTISDSYSHQGLIYLAFTGGVNNGTLATDSVSTIRENAGGYTVNGQFTNGFTAHEALLNDKGWTTAHLHSNIENLKGNVLAGGQNRFFNVLSSKYDWEIVTHPSWITIPTYSGVKSNFTKTISITFQPNNTGQKRDGLFELRKLASNGTEVPNRASITVTQNG